MPRRLDDGTGASPRSSWARRIRALALDVTPLRESRDYRLLWGGSFISFVGSRLTFVAVPFQVYQLTKSTLAVGLIGLLELIPILTLSLYGGALADAIDRRRLLLTGRRSSRPRLHVTCSAG